MFTTKSIVIIIHNTLSLNHIQWNLTLHLTLTLIRLETFNSQYSSPPLIRTPLRSNNSVLIREVSFGEKKHIFTVLAAKNLCPFQVRVLFRECPLRDGPLWYQSCTFIVMKSQKNRARLISSKFWVVLALGIVIHVIFRFHSIANSHKPQCIPVLTFYGDYELWDNW